MRKKLEYGDPFWMKYRADSQTVIDAIFDRRRNSAQDIVNAELSGEGLDSPVNQSVE